tara:strand:+ start:2837 stop:3958 length:1122 start_codon:yes stop_codon:yes gene_type:complete
MLQNKIYQNYVIEILKTFFTIVLGLSLLALTVRAVNFLELIVNNGYPVLTYFQYSFLNLFGIIPKFIPLAFFVSIIIFILKHNSNSEFIILWSSGVNKTRLVNLLFLSSFLVLVFYLFLSAILSPYALNKSRNLLSQDQYNSFLPTIRSQQFSDSFKGFTFLVDKKIDNELKNIFLHDTGNNLKKFSSDFSGVNSTTIIAEKGVVKNRNFFLINGQIISTKKNDVEIVNFEQLNINLNNLSASTIKQPKIQETSTLKLLSCFSSKFENSKICDNEMNKEIVPNLIRRLILPFYIPVISILCSFLLLKTNLLIFDKLKIYTSSFLLLVFTELLIRYTGINFQLRISYILLPFILMLIFYSIINFKLKTNVKKYE